MTSVNTTLTTQETCKYIGAFVAYNIGSLFVGGFRAYVAVTSLSSHFGKVEQFMETKKIIPYKVVPKENDGIVATVAPAVKNLDETAVIGKKDDEKRAIKQLGWRFPEEQRSFWWGQLIRAITEIIFPIIGSLVWTVVDFRNSGKELSESGSFKDVKTGKDIPGKHHIDKPQYTNPKDLFKYDVAGINTCKVALEWETDIKKVLPVKV